MEVGADPNASHCAPPLMLNATGPMLKPMVRFCEAVTPLGAAVKERLAGEALSIVWAVGSASTVRVAGT